MIDALFPHPVRFRQVWGQEWKHVSAFAWAAANSPGLRRAGDGADHPARAPRCAAAAVRPETMDAPRGDGAEAGVGKCRRRRRAASVWIVNELGVAHVVLGHELPEKETAEPSAAQMLPEDA